MNTPKAESADPTLLTLDGLRAIVAGVHEATRCNMTLQEEVAA
jgi:hypothetical protein